MFTSKDLRRILNHMQREQRDAIQVGVIALLVLPMIFVTAFM